jgi:hypothetical protein
MFSYVYALECPKAPEQIKKDWEVEVNTAIMKIGSVKGAELKTKTKKATEDLLGKLPDAGKIYLEQMMFSAYCTALRDDKNITESEKARLLKEYRKDVIQTIRKASAKKSKTTKPISQINQPQSTLPRFSDKVDKNVLPSGAQTTTNVHPIVTEQERNLPSGQSLPNIGAKLVIGDVSEEKYGFYIHLNSSIDSPTINNLRYQIKTPDMLNREFKSPLKRTLQPGRDFTIEFPPLLKISDYNSVTLNLLYSIDVKGTPHEFNFTFRFLFDRKLALRGNVIFPEAANQAEANEVVTDKNSKEDTLSRLGGPEGTMFLVLDEKNADGSFNKVSLGDSKKSLFFDPERRIVSFTFTLNGQMKTVKHSLRETPSKKHLVDFTWKDQKEGHLNVDGKEAE